MSASAEASSPTLKASRRAASRWRSVNCVRRRCAYGRCATSGKRDGVFRERSGEVRLHSNVMRESDLAQSALSAERQFDGHYEPLVGDAEGARRCDGPIRLCLYRSDDIAAPRESTIRMVVKLLAQCLHVMGMPHRYRVRIEFKWSARGVAAQRDMRPAC